MATTKEYLSCVLDQLSGVEGIRTRAMMGEYVLYYRDRVAGGIYDNRLMVKPVEAARALMPDAVLEAPYPGAKEMIVVDVLDSREQLARLLEAMYGQLPAPKPKKKKETQA